MEMTTTERRIRVLETRLNEALARLAAAEMALGKALQDAGLSGSGGATGSNTTLYDAFVTQGIAARNGNVLGFGYVQLVNATAHVLTATGNTVDSNVQVWNNTGGIVQVNSFCYVGVVGGLLRVIEADCSSTVNPGTPAAAPVAPP